MKMHKYFKEIDYISEAKKWRLNSILFIATAVSLPLIALTGILKPEAEELSIWFQRSGALMVLVSSLSEYHAFQMLNTFSPVEMANQPELTSKVNYCNQAKKLIIVAAICIGIGTVIWGYGDILYESA